MHTFTRPDERLPLYRVLVFRIVLSILVLVCISFDGRVFGQTDKGTFSRPRQVPGINGSHRDANPYFTADGLTTYFSSSRPSQNPWEDDIEAWDIWTATRNSTDDSFESLRKLDESISTPEFGELNPKLSADGLTLYYSSAPDELSGELLFVTRETIDSEWGAPQSIDAVNELGLIALNPHLSYDELNIYFEASDGPDAWDLYQASRTSHDEPFGDVVRVEGVNTDEFDERGPTVSADGRAIIYATPRDGIGVGFLELWIATRDSVDEPFKNPKNINNFAGGSRLNDISAAEYTPWLSQDWPAPGSKLYYVRSFNANDWDIWESTWHVKLMAGDADQDLDFDQLDLVRVQVAAKYLTSEAATWGEGDWNGVTGELVASPPVGDGLFNQLDIVAAQQAGLYLAGPYAAIRSGGGLGNVDLANVPEPGSALLAIIGTAIGVICCYRWYRQCVPFVIDL